MSALTPNSQRYVAVALIQESKLRTVSLVLEKATGRSLVAHQLHVPASVSSEAAAKRLEQAAEVLTQVKHPNVPSCAGCQCTPTGLWVLFEFVEGYPLSAYNGEFDKLSDQWIVWWLHHMLAMLAEVHRAGMVIGGLDPKHFLVSDKQLFLVHLGLLELVLPEAVALTRRPERLSFTAPEHRHSTLSSVPGDLFSVGAIAYWLATGKAPTHTTSDEEPQVAADILQGRPEFSPSVASVITGLVRCQAADRYQQASLALEAMAPSVPRLQDLVDNPPPVPSSMQWFGDGTIQRYQREAEKVERQGEPAPPPRLPEPDPLPVISRPPRRPWYDRLLWYAFRTRPILGWGTLGTLGILAVLLFQHQTRLGTASSAEGSELAVVSGNVRVLDRRSQAYKPDNAVTTLNAQMTADGSEDATLTYGQGSQVRMAGQTTFQFLRSPSPNQLRLTLLSGHAWFEPVGQDTVDVTLKTGTIECLGSNGLEVAAGDPTRVTATKGFVQVQSAGGTVMLNQGQSLTLPSSNKP